MIMFQLNHLKGQFCFVPPLCFVQRFVSARSQIAGLMISQSVCVTHFGRGSDFCFTQMIVNDCQK